MEVLEGVDWLRTIDLDFQGVPGCVASYLVTGDRECALIEVGPTSTIPVLTRGIQSAGYTWDDISRLIVTHIHLDHAGAAGVLMREHPHLRLSVHPAGAPHMIDPSRLIASAGRIYTDRMDPLWGEIAPIDASRVDVVADDTTIGVAGRRLRAVFTPGHAAHHLALLDEASGVLFTGDVAAVRVQGTDRVCASPPPPEFDPESWRTSVARMRALRPERLALTHFGLFDDLDRHFDQIDIVNQAVIDLARRRLGDGGSLDDLANDIRQFEADTLRIAQAATEMRQIEMANPAYMAAMGLQRYLRVLGEIAR